MRSKLVSVFQYFGGISFLFLSGCVASQPPAPVVSVDQLFAPAAITPVETSRPGLLPNRPERGSLQGSTYQVKAGDTLYSIAWAAGQDYRTLATFNNLQAPFLIHPGDRLYLQQTLSPQDLAKSGNPSATIVKPSESAGEKPHNNSVDKPKTESYSGVVAAQKPNNVVVSTKPVVPVTAPTSTVVKVDPNVQPSAAVVATKPSNTAVKVKPSQAVSIVKPSTPALPDRVATWQWPLKGKIIRHFSDAEHGNNGLDIAAPIGTPVFSAAQGQVVYAGSALRGYGQLIIVKHSDEYLSAYAHNSKLLVKELQQIQAGQKIAEVGSTEADRSMLHFEIRYKGKSVDPLRYLPR